MVTHLTNDLDFLFIQVLPCLRSFCLYCSIGIMMVYILHVTFFVGCMVFDQVGLQSWWC